MSQIEGSGPAETGVIPARRDDGNGAVGVPRVPAGAPDDVWADDDFGSEEEGASAGLASGPLLSAAVRRRWWLWCLIGVVGLVAGLAFTVVLPAAPQASATVLVAHNPNENPADAILTDVALAQSRTVAVDAMRQLGLPRTVKGVARFQGSYSVTQVTDRLILFMAKAPTSGQAVARVKVLADEFLQLRGRELQSGQQDTVAAIDRQITQAKGQIAATAKQIAAIAPAQVSAGQLAPSVPPAGAGSLSRANRARLAELQTQHSQQEAALNGLEQALQAYQVSNQVAVSAEVAGSQVLDAPAPVHRSLVRHALLYAVAGLVGGLLLGLALVIVQALVSGRLRWRDDIARALGAPIHLSVGRLRAARWRPGRAGRDRDVQRVVAHLRSAVPARGAGAAAGLAVVAVDNAKEVAPSLVALAVSYAQEGKQVVLADLADGAPAARLLQIKRPSTGTVRVNAVRVHGLSLMVAVPGRGSAALAGPLPPPWPAQPGVPGVPGPPGLPSEPVAAVYASADLLITLADLDPTAGADHLPTWADSAVVTVTAGQSSGTRIHAVGEMIRLAGTPLASAVLIGADKNDESLGATIYTPTPDTTPTPTTSHPAPQPTTTETPNDDTEDLEAVLDGGADTNGSRDPGPVPDGADTNGSRDPGPVPDGADTNGSRDPGPVPDGADTNGSRDPELLVSEGPRLTGGLSHPEWRPPD
jgi:capsular polysaccharide biosynthesis protein